MEEHLHELNPSTKKFFRWPGDITAPTPSCRQLMHDYYKIVRQIGGATLKAALDRQSPLHGYRYSPSVCKMMWKEGWWGGTGLGKSKQGIKDPIMMEKKKAKHTPLVGVATGEDFRVLGNEVFGYLKKIVNVEYIQLADLSYSGIPIPTDSLRRCDHSRAREVLRWKGVLGIAENTYPHPEGVTFEEVTSGRPLSKLRVSHLTQAFVEHSQHPPNYEAAWERALGEESLPWHLVRQRIHHPALSPKDKKPSLRILHRSLYTRTWKDPRATCRLCGEAYDRLSHLGTCPHIKYIFKMLFDDYEITPKFIYLGLTKDNAPLKGWETVFHTLIWKFILIAYTRHDLHNEPFDGYCIIESVLHRSAVRLEAYAHQIKMRWVHEQSQGGELKKSWLQRCDKTVAPLMSFDEEGNLRFSEAMYTVYTMAGIYKDRPHKTRKERVKERPYNLAHEYDKEEHTDKPPPPEWLIKENERNSKLRKINARVARENKKRLTHNNT